jgi:hypothetical protein
VAFVTKPANNEIYLQNLWKPVIESKSYVGKYFLRTPVINYRDYLPNKISLSYDNCRFIRYENGQITDGTALI